MTVWRRVATAVLLASITCLAVARQANADPARDALTPMRTSALPALPVTATPTGMGTVDGTAVAIGGGAAWALDDGATAWRSVAWPRAMVPADMAGIGSDGKNSYLLSGSGGHVDTVARLQLSPAGGLSVQPLPALPMPLDGAMAAISDTAIYVGGGAKGIWRIFRIDPSADRPAWSTVSAWPGVTNVSSMVVQTGALFVTAPSGDGEAIWRYIDDGGWSRRGILPGRVLPPPRPIGQAHVLYLVAPAKGAAPITPVTFQTITSSWTKVKGNDLPSAPLAVMPWHDGIAWASAADGRTAVTTAQFQGSKLLLKWLDWIVIVVYLASMIGIGLYFYLREKRNSTSNFFVGGRSIPFWAAGVSLYAANTSSISFIAIPAKAFESNWQYLTNNLIAVFGLMFVAVWIVPLLRRLDLMSVFSYLETRFHPAIRMIASALCILTQLGSRMSVILFLPALAIATITGISTTWSVILMGGFTIIYTAMGGMKAVIWTDFVQVIVKMGGAIFAIGFIIWSLHGGVGQFWSTAMAEHKMHLFDFSFDLTKATVWGFMFLVLFDVVLTFPKDQVLMQRTLSTKSDKEAGRSIWAFAAMMIPGGFVFYMIGTALFVFYKAHPERMNPLLPIDATFPLFIAAELPMGVTGLIIAGIFAAAMATLSGIMNSVATLVSVDFFDKLVKNPTPRQSVLFAELTTVAVGLVGIGLALVLSRFDVHSLFDVSIELAGLLGGGFAGAYTLGMFTRRANAPGVAIGVVGSISLTFVAWVFRLVHPYFYLAISIFLCIVIGYVASLFFPPPAQSLRGLTIYRDGPEHH
ncbi:sodium:solute symporter [Pinirhizobacter sp.]|jgi:SSS family transporter|uniref:sodium:solute symporter n=1 Tax=Pinirhizobacter sp. TaxID=2950432 RepID=UPI002F42DFFF